MAIIHIDWHNKPETCTIGGKTCNFKSQIERKWANYLQILKDLGAIEDWEYEPKTFQFKERCRIKRQYTPDFSVIDMLEDCRQTVYHEVKTALRQTDIRRFKLMAADFPNEIMVLILPYCSRKSNQSRLRGNALKYIARIVYAGPLFNKFSIK